MGFDHVPAVRSPLQPTHPKNRDPWLGGTTQQSDEPIELGNVASKHRTDQVENEIRLKGLKISRKHANIIYIYISFIVTFCFLTIIKCNTYIIFTYIILCIILSRVFGVFLVTGDDGTTFCFFYRQDDHSENNIFFLFLFITFCSYFILYIYI